MRPVPRTGVLDRGGSAEISACVGEGGDVFLPGTLVEINGQKLTGLVFARALKLRQPRLLAGEFLEDVICRACHGADRVSASAPYLFGYTRRIQARVRRSVDDFLMSFRYSPWPRLGLPWRFSNFARQSAD